MPNIFDGAVVTFRNLGDHQDPNYVFLNGLTGAIPFGGVDLAPKADNTLFTGTHWQCSNVGGDIYTLACAGSIFGSRYLNGNTYDGSVNLAGDTLDPFSGTKWQVQELDNDRVFLACQGAFNNPDFLYLDGRTYTGTVGLAPHGGEPYSGALWATQLVAVPTLSVTTRRDLTASLLDVAGTNFHAFDRVLFAAEGIVGQVEHLPLAIGNYEVVNVNAVGAFHATIVVDRVRAQPYDQPVIIRATDEHGVSAVALSNGFSY
jgi:hypothetical protein